MDPVMVDVNEASRTYFFKSGNKVTFEDVVAVELLCDDVHTLYLADGSEATISGDYDVVQVEERA